MDGLWVMFIRVAKMSGGLCMLTGIQSGAALGGE
jgi:hypothetical protein